MDRDEYRRMFELEDRHFWFRGVKGIVFDQFLAQGGTPDSLILDAGCGTGGTIRFFDGRAKLIGVDNNPDAIEFSRTKAGNDVRCSDLAALPFEDYKFAFVLALDVLEHVKEEEKALSEIRRVLRGNGKLIVTAPAHQWLFSTHDIALSHLRRYGREELREKIEAAGFRILKISYFNSFLFPAISLARLVKKAVRDSGKEAKSDLKLPPPFLNKLLEGVFAVEKMLLRKINLPVGVSLLVIGEKR